MIFLSREEAILDEWNDNVFFEEMPDVAKEAAREVQEMTQAPMPMICAAILSSISLSCQESVDVYRNKYLYGPVNIFSIVIADSGERKSAVDKLIMKPIYQFEERGFEEYLVKKAKYDHELMIISEEEKALLSKLKRAVKNQEDTEGIKICLADLKLAYPIPPPRYKFIFSDATSAAIKDYLCGTWRSIGIMSDEGGVVFDGYALNELPFINKLWDGSGISVERKNGTEVPIKDARLTLSLMVQLSILKRFLERRGEMAHDVGFFPRCLICKPESTQGYRQITRSSISTVNLTRFHNRLTEMLNESVDRNISGKRLCLNFSPEAEKKWMEFYNITENEMQSFGTLFKFKGYASKMAENMARVAALLHCFSSKGDEISIESVKSAHNICIWYMTQYKKIFSKESLLSTTANDENELWSWIYNQSIKESAESGVPYIMKNFIRQFGPSKFRDKNILNDVLTKLALQGRVIVRKVGRTIFVEPQQTLGGGGL
ncbi:YfjI family protein [Serratia fonticola]